MAGGAINLTVEIHNMVKKMLMEERMSGNNRYIIGPDGKTYDMFNIIRNVEGAGQSNSASIQAMQAKINELVQKINELEAQIAAMSTPTG